MQSTNFGEHGGEIRWREVTKKCRCPICGRPDWCTVHAGAAHCMRVKSEKRVASGGWIHLLTKETDVAVLPPKAPPRPKIDCRTLQQEYVRHVNPKRLGVLSAALGVPVVSLMALDVGFDEERGAWTFPMRDEFRTIIGIRLRDAKTHRKYAIAGSRNGLFLPVWRGRGPIVIVEGPTDAAAMLSLGFDVVGRSFCDGNGPELQRLLHNERRDVVIVPDNDASGVGMAGAVQLRSLIHVRHIVSPPAGVKDARDWLTAGLTREQFLEMCR